MSSTHKFSDTCKIMNSKENSGSDFSELRKFRTTHQSQLTKLYKEIEKKLVTYDNAEIVKTLATKVNERFQSFQEAHSQCLDKCSDCQMIDTLEKNFDSCKKNFEELCERISQWFNQISDIVNLNEHQTDVATTENKSSENREIDDMSSISTTPSMRSSRSRFRDARVKRLKAEQQIIALSRKQELERARREIEDKEKIIEQQAELEIARLEESVWQEAVIEDEGETQKVSESLTHQSTEDRRNVRCRPPYATEPEVGNTMRTMNTVTRAGTQGSSHDIQDQGNQMMGPSVSSTTIDVAFSRLASVLQEGFNLPKPEILSFNGSPMDYTKFIKNFETNIEYKISDNSTRLSYLIQYCKGEAKSSIEDCVLLEPTEGYKRAREILYSRYGRSHVIVRSYIDKLVYGEQIKASDVDSLSKLALEMQKCEITLSQLGFRSDIDNSDNLRRIVKRIPMHLRTRWVEVAHLITESGREPRFSDLAKFVDEKSRIANSMYGLDLTRENKSHVKSKDLPNHHDSEVKGKITTLTTLNTTEFVKKEKKCVCCSGTCKELAECNEFKSMNLTDRSNFVKQNNLCFNCLKMKHVAKSCRKAKMCSVPECKGKHHMLLHRWVRTNDHATVEGSLNCSTRTNVKAKMCLGIVPIKVYGENGKSYCTYGLLDDGADKTMCDERLLEILNLKGRTINFEVTTMTSSGSSMSGKELDLDVSSVNGDSKISIPKVWTVKRLPISTRSAAPRCELEKYDYLCDLDIPEIESDEVMLLIGTDAPSAHIPLEVRAGGNDQPYAVRSSLGWAVRGPIEADAESKIASVHYQRVKNDVLQEQLERMWTTDFNEVTSKKDYAMSLEDRQSMGIMKSNSFGLRVWRVPTDVDNHVCMIMGENTESDRQMFKTDADDSFPAEETVKQNSPTDEELKSKAEEEDDEENLKLHLSVDNGDAVENLEKHEEERDSAIQLKSSAKKRKPRVFQIRDDEEGRDINAEDRENIMGAKDGVRKDTGSDKMEDGGLFKVPDDDPFVLLSKHGTQQVTEAQEMKRTSNFIPPIEDPQDLHGSTPAILSGNDNQTSQGLNFYIEESQSRMFDANGFLRTYSTGRFQDSESEKQLFDTQADTQNMDELMGRCSGKFEKGKTGREKPQMADLKKKSPLDEKKDNSNDFFKLASDHEEEDDVHNEKDAFSDDERSRDGEGSRPEKFTGFTIADKHCEILREFVEAEAELSGREYGSVENLDVAKENDIMEKKEGEMIAVVCRIEGSEHWKYENQDDRLGYFIVTNVDAHGLVVASWPNISRCRYFGCNGSFEVKSMRSQEKIWKYRLPEDLRSRIQKSSRKSRFSASVNLMALIVSVRMSKINIPTGKEPGMLFGGLILTQVTVGRGGLVHICVVKNSNSCLTNQ